MELYLHFRDNKDSYRKLVNLIDQDEELSTSEISFVRYILFKKYIYQGLNTAETNITYGTSINNVIEHLKDTNGSLTILLVLLTIVLARRNYKESYIEPIVEDDLAYMTITWYTFEMIYCGECIFLINSNTINNTRFVESINDNIYRIMVTNYSYTKPYIKNRYFEYMFLLGYSFDYSDNVDLDMKNLKKYVDIVGMKYTTFFLATNLLLIDNIEIDNNVLNIMDMRELIEKITFLLHTWCLQADIFIKVIKKLNVSINYIYFNISKTNSWLNNLVLNQI